MDFNRWECISDYTDTESPGNYIWACVILSVNPHPTLARRMDWESVYNKSFKQFTKIEYLGVIIDSNLNFKPYTGKIKQKLYPIITSFQRNRKFLTPKLAALWYVGPIRSNLETCAPLLYTTNDYMYIKNEFLKIENRCLKIIDYNSSKDSTSKSF